ncbi:unnamed protein product [Leptosia nina]|uniref:Uncharacterized protein n=1 Tax=Leptosia nina TaxID=320188 RepID=A0AAV1K6J1_9NEOP
MEQRGGSFKQPYKGDKIQISWLAGLAWLRSQAKPAANFTVYNPLAVSSLINTLTNKPPEMFYRALGLLALIAGVLAAPKPDPAPQLLTYTAGLDYVYPGSVPSIISPYNAQYASLAYPGYPVDYYFR